MGAGDLFDASLIEFVEIIAASVAEDVAASVTVVAVAATVVLVEEGGDWAAVMPMMTLQ